MTDDLVDRQKIATELTKRAIDRVLIIGEKKIKEYWAKYKNRDISTYADYLVRKGEQASMVRNFIYDFRSASLYDIYVPAKIENLTEIYKGDDFLHYLCAPVDGPQIRPTRALAITGNAGTGKTLFFKHAFFKIQDISANRIPVLMEARNFNRRLLADLETRICEEFASTGKRIIQEQVTNALVSGLFVILLDGMDELKGVIQEHYEAELISFVRKFPLCPVLVSSRPTARISSWAEIDKWSIAPLNDVATEDLVTRLEFNEDVKAKFIKLLHEDLFNTHYEFVSVPLLCTIMLLTYSDSGHISNNRHEFFEDAFTALWSKHDGRKDGFERHRYTGLQKYEFSKLLSAFAISSYNSADYDMRSAQFHHHFKIATRLSGVTCKEDDFLKDITISTSLIIEEGSYIRFCHRAFHEYFSALFICEMSDYSIAGQLMEEVCDRLETDHVLPLVLSINDEKIEKHWVLPKMKSIAACIAKTNQDLYRYARVVVGEDKSEDKISDAMVKVRILYQLNPVFEELSSTYDAARHMRTRVARMLGDDRSNCFKRDRENFQRLNERLLGKYERKSSALDELLGRTELEGRAESEP